MNPNVSDEQVSETVNRIRAYNEIVSSQKTKDMLKSMEDPSKSFKQLSALRDKYRKSLGDGKEE